MYGGPFLGGQRDEFFELRSAMATHQTAPQAPGRGGAFVGGQQGAAGTPLPPTPTPESEEDEAQTNAFYLATQVQCPRHPQLCL